MKHSHTWRAIAVMTTAALFVASCGDDDTTSSSTTTTSTTGSSTDGSTSTTGAPKKLVAGPGFDGSTINLGVLVPLSGLPAIIGNPLAAGQEAYWAYVNDELGGIAGKYPVATKIEDTLYETNTTVQKYNKIKDDVVLFAQVMGTPHNLALLPLLNDDNIVAAPASQDAFWVREQQMLPIIEPYQVDVINGIDYWLRNGGTTDTAVCAVIQNDVYGEAGLEGLEYAADEFGFDVATVSRFKLGDTEFTAQVNELQGKGCELVWTVALPTEFGGLLRTAAQHDFAPQWIAQSPAWVDELGGGDLKAYLEAHVLIAATGPEWGDTSVAGVADLMDRLEKYRPDQEPDYYFSFGYFQAMAVHQLLEAAVAAGDLSREGIVTAMNGLEELTFDGMIGDYGYGPPEDREPSRQSTMFKVNMAKPFGLEALEFNFTSDAAAGFEFVKADL